MSVSVQSETLERTSATEKITEKKLNTFSRRIRGDTNLAAERVQRQLLATEAVTSIFEDEVNGGFPEPQRHTQAKPLVVAELPALEEERDPGATLDRAAEACASTNAAHDASVAAKDTHAISSQSLPSSKHAVPDESMFDLSENELDAFDPEHDDEDEDDVGKDAALVQREAEELLRKFRSVAERRSGDRAVGSSGKRVRARQPSARRRRKTSKQQAHGSGLVAGRSGEDEDQREVYDEEEEEVEEEEEYREGSATEQKKQKQKSQQTRKNRTSSSRSKAGRQLKKRQSGSGQEDVYGAEEEKEKEEEVERVRPLTKKQQFDYKRETARLTRETFRIEYLNMQRTGPTVLQLRKNRLALARQMNHIWESISTPDLTHESVEEDLDDDWDLHSQKMQVHAAATRKAQLIDELVSDDLVSSSDEDVRILDVLPARKSTSARDQMKKLLKKNALRSSSRSAISFSNSMSSLPALQYQESRGRISVTADMDPMQSVLSADTRLHPPTTNAEESIEAPEPELEQDELHADVYKDKDSEHSVVSVPAVATLDLEEVDHVEDDDVVVLFDEEDEDEVEEELDLMAEDQRESVLAAPCAGTVPLDENDELDELDGDTNSANAGAMLMDDAAAEAGSSEEDAELEEELKEEHCDDAEDVQDRQEQAVEEQTSARAMVGGLLVEDLRSSASPQSRFPGLREAIGHSSSQPLSSLDAEFTHSASESGGHELRSSQLSLAPQLISVVESQSIPAAFLRASAPESDEESSSGEDEEETRRRMRRTLRRSHTWSLKQKQQQQQTSRGSLPTSLDSSENSNSRSRSSFLLDESSRQSLQRVQKLNIRKRPDRGSLSRGARPASFSSRSRMDDHHSNDDAHSVMDPPRSRSRSVLRNSSLLTKFNELHGHKSQQQSAGHSRSAFMFASEDSNASMPAADVPSPTHSSGSSSASSRVSHVKRKQSAAEQEDSHPPRKAASSSAKRPALKKKRSLFSVLSKDRFDQQ